MSEINYIYQSITPRMPKSVSNEQLFVFVPIGTEEVIGIFKADTTDFDKTKFPTLKLIEDASMINDGVGYIRTGIIKTYVDGRIDYVIDDYTAKLLLKQDKTDDGLKTSQKTIVGAINEVHDELDIVKGTANTNKTDIANLTARVSTAEGKITALEGDVETVENTVAGFDSRISQNATNISNLQGTVGEQATDINTLKGDVNTLQTTVDEHASDIADLMTKDGELEGKITTNTEDIADNTAKIATNTTDINNLKQAAYTGETPIGTYPSSATLPTSDQLTAFVQQEVSRAPKIGDVVLFTQTVSGDTDKSYKFMYTATGWGSYVIPTVEAASNTDKGIVQGTYGDATGNLQVSIVNGKIADIYLKDGNTYKTIKSLLDTLSGNITILGNTVTANKTAADTGIAEAKAAAAAVIKKYNSVEFTFVSDTDNTITNFPCKYTATIDGVTTANVADVYFSAVQIPLEIFSSYVLVEAGKISIFATTKVNYPTSVTVPTVRIS